MHQSPGDVVREYFDAWNRRDLDALRSTLDPDAQWHRGSDFPEGRTLRGGDSIVDFARTMFDVFAQTPIEVERLVEAEGGRVVVAGTTTFRGQRSAAETSNYWVRVYTVGGDGISQVRVFESFEDALGSAAATESPGGES